MMAKYVPSSLREHYDETITADAATNLPGFKSRTVNYKLGYWDPRPNGVRYLKALIYHLAAGLSPENRERLRRIRNRDVGDPISVIYDGEQVCMDSLLSVLELEFLAAGMPLDGLRVLEVGGGYGRTCHAMMSNHELASYAIVDLPRSLELSREYLRAVLDDQRFARIRFVTPDEVDALAADGLDLCLGVNAFAEMPIDTVRDYLRLADSHSGWFYVRDAVGKYADPGLDGRTPDDQAARMALRNGVLQDVLDIHDSEAVREHSRKFVAAYRPGPGWTCAADAWAPPWSFFWQALYRADRAA
ncbi:putative sugar O-methyltransferase [Solwaraspora sp. WMMA2056]|uniref:putative sugar O-methyltransferase n=1 Tax=Solwaraspora sp. WMMA2056 TaxID=3015161 RepID=UPI00259BCC4B|nr:putative sugar O-methyltransferase [Solwaraspora sp. WMMA2056]WJK42561.1 putative sugar O-methyltransferase [Solwaraspora sp. WMMA2056]